MGIKNGGAVRVVYCAFCLLPFGSAEGSAMPVRQNGERNHDEGSGRLKRQRRSSGR